MAERRMFAKSIIESDPFMDMPAEAQMLYVHLNMAADDDGFCDNPRTIMRQCGAGDDAMKILIAKKFVLTFEKRDNFIVVIKHWRMNNYIRKDNYRETRYKQFMRELYYDENRSYSTNPGDGHIPCIPGKLPRRSTSQSPTCDEPVTDQSHPRIQSVDESYTSRIQSVDESYTSRIQSVDESLTQDRIGKSKDRVGKESTDKDSLKPSLEIEEGKGVQGENQPDRAVLSGPAREARIIELKKCVASFLRFHYDPACWYRMAEAEGITAEEITPTDEERTDSP